MQKIIDIGSSLLRIFKIKLVTFFETRVEIGHTIDLYNVVHHLTLPSIDCGEK